MHATSAPPSSAEVATEVTGLFAGLGILTMALFPFALPGLLLALPLALLVAPLALIAVPVLLLVGILVLPLRLARVVLRSRSRRAFPTPAPGTPSLR
jgi:hypothetical protein